MSLQNTFYLIGIICMTLYTILLIGIVVLLLYIKTKLTEVTKRVDDKIHELKDYLTHPKDIAASMGAAVAGTFFQQAGKFMHNHR